MQCVQVEQLKVAEGAVDEEVAQEIAALRCATHQLKSTSACLSDFFLCMRRCANLLVSSLTDACDLITASQKLCIMLVPVYSHRPKPASKCM